MKVEIADNILRHYLRNVLFINGNAYAGKSTACALLAKEFGLVHCGENYGINIFTALATPEKQPNMCYFRNVRTNNDWQAFLNRTPEEYAAWIDGSSREIGEFEVTHLLWLAAKQKVIVDTNIPVSRLKQIASYHQVAVMLAPPAMAVERFFARDDADKQFLLGEIEKASDPEKTRQNFRACLARANSQERFDALRTSGFYTLIRSDDGRDTRAETVAALARHFGLSQDQG